MTALVRDVAEVDAERPQLAIQVRAFHAHALGELPHLAVAQQQLLLQIGALELLAGLAQRQREQVLLDQRLDTRRLGRELPFDFLEPDLLAAALQEQALHEILELAHVVGPGVVAQPVLGGDAEFAELQAFAVHHAIDVVAQQVGHVFGVFTQRRHPHDERVEVREQITTKFFAAALDARSRRRQHPRLEWHRHVFHRRA